jgi:hypothetical protein
MRGGGGGFINIISNRNNIILIYAISTSDSNRHRRPIGVCMALIAELQLLESN